jgi:hypothetical protein
VDDFAEIGRLTVRTVRQRGRHHPGLQAEGAQPVELVPGEHHDALGILAHHSFARGVADGPVGWTGVDRGRVGRTRFVWPALIAQHTGAGDLGRAGDDRLSARRGRFTLAERPAPTEHGHRQCGRNGG